jgi:hypothetical protein
MKLLEFFNPNASSNKDESSGKTKHTDEKLSDELYWYILDHDRLHKEFFIPIAKEISEKIKQPNFDRVSAAKKFLPMINNACMDYYRENGMTEDPKDVFTKEMRQGLCQRLADQSYDDIEKGEYQFN